MNTTVNQIEKLIFQDPGKRDLALWGAPGELAESAKSLAHAKHVLITTGFYIINSLLSIFYYLSLLILLHMGGVPAKLGRWVEISF